MLYSRTNAIVQRLTAYAIRRGVLLWYASFGTPFGMNLDMLYSSLLECLCIALVGTSCYFPMYITLMVP